MFVISILGRDILAGSKDFKSSFSNVTLSWLRFWTLCLGFEEAGTDVMEAHPGSLTRTYSFPVRQDNSDSSMSSQPSQDKE